MSGAGGQQQEAVASGAAPVAPQDVPEQLVPSAVGHPEVWPAKLPPRLRRFPNTSFGVAMGLAGNAVLWKTMHAVSFTHEAAPEAVVWFFFLSGSAVLGIFFTIYLAKSLVHPDMVLKEWEDGIRSNFFHTPVLSSMILTIGCPDSIEDMTCKRVVWVACFALQVLLNLAVYNRWMYIPNTGLGESRPPMLLSTVGWFLLSILATVADIEGLLGLDMASLTFGVGFLFLAVLYVSLLQQIHEAKVGGRGHPGMFLLLAPPSVASIALIGITGGYGPFSRAILGAMIFLLLLLLRSGPTILKEPVFFGVYWAYTFPLAALATSGVRHAQAVDTFASKFLAWALIGVAEVGLIVVFSRMSYHMLQVLRGQGSWPDPLAVSAPKAPPPPLPPATKDAEGPSAAPPV